MNSRNRAFVATQDAEGKVSPLETAAPVQNAAFSIVRKDRQFAVMGLPNGGDNSSGAPA